MELQALYAVLSVIGISLISFVGLLTLTINNFWTKKVLNLLISFSAGALLGDVFLHLLPQLAGKNWISLKTSAFILATIALFYIMEKFVHWHHHQDEESGHYHHLVVANLVGDGIHNIIDGLIVGGAYLLDVRLGLATTIAVIMHEIPQEFGDFGILLYSGLSKTRALTYNFFSALTALIGVIIAISINSSDQLEASLIALAIGSFIYLAVADLIPETHKQKSRFTAHLISFICGIGIMYLLLFLD